MVKVTQGTVLALCQQARLTVGWRHLHGHFLGSQNRSGMETSSQLHAELQTLVFTMLRPGSVPLGYQSGLRQRGEQRGAPNMVWGLLGGDPTPPGHGQGTKEPWAAGVTPFGSSQLSLLPRLTHLF